MSYRFLALIEDLDHEQALRGLLDRSGARARRLLRIEPYPRGKGAGEQHVRKRFPAFVARLRSKPFQQSLWGIVVIDGDVEGMAHRRARLLETVTPPLTTDDRIILLVPTRNVQTWAWCILGNQTDERSDFKSQITESLRTIFRDNWLPPQASEPLSLIEGRREWDRLP